MSRNFKFTASFFLLSIPSLLKADSDTDSTFRNWDSRLTILESKRPTCCVMPPARPTQKCGWGAYVTIDPLWMRAEENGLAFVAITQNEGQVNPNFAQQNSIIGNSKLKNLHFKSDFGFRLGIGLNLPHDGWDLGLNWTRFWTDAKKHVKAGPTTLLTPTFANGQQYDLSSSFITLGAINQGMLTEAKSDWRLHLNQIDMALGRQFFVSRWLSLKPYAGLRTAWIHQKDKIHYLNFFSSPGSPVVNNLVHTMKCNYWGLGLLGGLDAQWRLGSGFSLFADGSASILYGYFQISSDESSDGFFPTSILFPAHTFSTDLFDTHDFYHLNRFITDLSAGVRYDYLFCEERYHIGLQLGWETHLFFGQSQFQRFLAAPQGSSFSFPAEFIANQGDLSLNGLSLQVQFDF